MIENPIELGGRFNEMDYVVLIWMCCIVCQWNGLCRTDFCLSLIWGGLNELPSDLISIFHSSYKAKSLNYTMFLMPRSLIILLEWIAVLPVMLMILRMTSSSLVIKWINKRELKFVMTSSMGEVGFARRKWNNRERYYGVHIHKYKSCYIY